MGTKKDPLARPKIAHQFTPQTPEEIKKDIDLLLDGQLPPRVTARINNTVSGKLPWASTLDINDLYLAEDIGIEPVTLVGGNCTWHAQEYNNSWGNQAHDESYVLDSYNNAVHLVDAFYEAKDQAMKRMLDEALLAQAHAVINARHSFHKIGKNTVYFNIIGTAVRFRGVALPRTPLVSPMSGEDFFKLLRKGYIPVGFALGFQRRSIPIGWNTQKAQYSWANQEFESLTKSLMRARDDAMLQMTRDAQNSPWRANGIIGVDIKMEMEPTKISYINQYSSLVVDGTIYTPDNQGVLEVPGFSAEFFATGSTIANLPHSLATKEQLSTYLQTV